MLMVPWQGRTTPLQMGLRACAPEQWLDEGDLFGRDDDFHAQIAEKNRLLDTHLSAIYAALPGSEPACLETCQLVAEAKEIDGPVSSASAENQDMPLLAEMSRQIAEDLLLLAPADEPSSQPEWTLQAACLAFPSHWRLADKMGKPMAAIHAPVPDYQARLDKPVNRFFSAMLPDTISVRYNWTLQIDSHLHAPMRIAAPLGNVEEVPTRLYVRVERQTFRKLPDTGWVVFGIRSYIAPLKLWADQPDALQELIRIVQNFSPAMRQYRDAGRYESWLEKWVDSL